jgi:hypothetical protein
MEAVAGTGGCGKPVLAIGTGGKFGGGGGNPALANCLKKSALKLGGGGNGKGTGGGT